MSFCFSKMGLHQALVGGIACLKKMTCGLYYNRVTIVATIVTQISWIILIIFKLLNVTTNDLAYLSYDRSYDRNTVIVQATG